MDSGCGVDFIVFHIGDWIQHLGERCLEHPSPLFKTSSNLELDTSVYRIYY